MMSRKRLSRVPGRQPVGEPTELYQADLTGFRSLRRAAAGQVSGYKRVDVTQTVANGSFLVKIQYRINKTTKTLACCF
jgi:hypothetical protein